MTNIQGMDSERNPRPGVADTDKQLDTQIISLTFMMSHVIVQPWASVSRPGPDFYKKLLYVVSPSPLIIVVD